MTFNMPPRIFQVSLTMKHCELRSPRDQFVVALLAAVLGLSSLSGCEGETGPKRYHVNGLVKYDGIPVHSGRITFAPDNSKNNEGPAGWAVIQNGLYDTEAVGGKAPVSGPMTVLISGYGEPPAKKVETPEPLFPDYTTTTEIDANDTVTTFDIDIPASTTKKK